MRDNRVYHKVITTLLLTVVTLSSAYAIEDKREKRQPNIVIFLADDMGYGDVKWTNPNAYTDTPNLMRLADGGATLQNCYSASSMCSPSRAGLMTGKTPLRTGVHHWIKEIFKEPKANIHLRGSEITIAEQLKSIGYRTAMCGKWHLNNEFNCNSKSDPNDQGFDYSFASPVHAEPSHRNPNNFYENGVAVGPLGTDDSPKFAAELVADRAIEWLKEQDSNTPLFLYVPFQEAHVVCSAPDTLIEKYQKRIASGEIPLIKGTGDMGLGQAEYYGSINSMDIAIGRIVEELKKIDNLDNTIIIFSSDNGPDTNRRVNGRLQSVGVAAPFSGRKQWLLEGGIHQASLIYWKGVVEEGSTIKEPISQLDIFPTLSAIADIPLPTDSNIDGVDISPLLRGDRFKRETPLFWHFHGAKAGSPQSVLRDGKWVITADWGEKRYKGRFDLAVIDDIKRAELSNFKLYNIELDPAQLNNLAETNPKRLSALKRELLDNFRSVRGDVPDALEFRWTPHLDSISRTRYGSL